MDPRSTPSQAPAREEDFPPQEQMPLLEPQPQARPAQEAFASQLGADVRTSLAPFLLP